MKKNGKIIGLLIVVVLIGMQFVPVAKNEAGYASVAAFEDETKPSAAMQQLLRAKCYDCHSNQTKYPWYAAVAPVSFWLAHHVDEGKEHFNVSEWDSYTIKKKDHKLEELIEEVEEGEMPLNSYTWLHGDITDTERTQLIEWVRQLRTRYTAAQ